MVRYRYDARLYEDRYRRVYEAGAAFWEEPIPTETLVKFLSKANLRRDLNAIDMGCGEGRDSVFLAKSGFNVTSVDTSPSAIKRAKELTEKETVHIDFLVADISNLPIRRDTYDLAINISLFAHDNVSACKRRPPT